MERGSIAALETAPPYELSRFKARLFWLGRNPFTKGRLYKLKLATQEVDCEIESVQKVIDASSLETHLPRAQRNLCRAARGRRTGPAHQAWPVAFDAHAEIVATGRFVIVDGLEVCGGGIVAEDDYPRRSSDALHKSDNIFWSHGKVTAGQRAARNGHAGFVLVAHGAFRLGQIHHCHRTPERELFNLGRHAYLLDGDKMRHGLCSDLAFSPEDPQGKNIRRVGEVARNFFPTAVASSASPRLFRPIARTGKLVREIEV